MEKILIVQDSTPIGIMMKSMLEAENFQVLWVKSGEEAVEEAKKENFNIIFLDYGLPGINGGLTCRIIRSEGQNMNTPVIFVSAKTDEEIAKIVEQSGAQGSVGEVCDPEELIAKVKSYLRKDGPSEAETDKQGAAEELGMPKELYAKIFGAFMQEAGDVIAKLDELRKAQDFEALRKAGHFIKGSSGSLKLIEVHTIAKEIEYFDPNKNPVTLLDDAILRLKTAFGAIKKLDS